MSRRNDDAAAWTFQGGASSLRWLSFKDAAELHVSKSYADTCSSAALLVLFNMPAAAGAKRIGATLILFARPWTFRSRSCHDLGRPARGLPSTAGHVPAALVFSIHSLLPRPPFSFLLHRLAFPSAFSFHSLSIRSPSIHIPIRSTTICVDHPQSRSFITLTFSVPGSTRVFFGLHR